MQLIMGRGICRMPAGLLHYLPGSSTVRLGEGHTKDLTPVCQYLPTSVQSDHTSHCGPSQPTRKVLEVGLWYTPVQGGA